MARAPKFPRGLNPGLAVAPTATSFWFPVESLEAQVKAGSGLTYRNGKIWLGRTPTDSGEPVGWMDDRHMATIAASRSGKGTSAIIPTLCDYPGSIICIDPKGENAFHTAPRRGYGDSRIEGMHQDVYVLDPYDVSKVNKEYLASFDPLAGLEPDADDTLEEAGLIAEALVVSTDPKDEHWDDSARAFVEALILHVVSWPMHEGDRSLGRVRTLVRDGDREEREKFREQVKTQAKPDPAIRAKLNKLSAFDVLLGTMEANDAFDGVIAGIASGLKDLGDRERGSVLSTARRNLKFLDAPKMKACLQRTDHTLRLQDLKRAQNGATVYLVLPARLMKTHARWLRLILNLTVARLEKDPEPPAKGKNLPVLAILDEFPTLQHLPIIETAIGYMAGFGLKLWVFLQDLSQLKRDYPDSWETFLGNAGLLQFFACSDPTTLEFISKRLGDMEVIRETENNSETETISVSDISDFDKLQRSSGGKGFARAYESFALENSTESHSKSLAGSTTTSQAIQKTALMTPDEVRRYFSRASGLQIIATADNRPFFLRRTPYFEDPYFKDKYHRDPQELATRPSSSS